MKLKSAIGISLPDEVIRRIDTERKDVSRSRYLLRLLERAHNILEQNEVEKQLE